MAGGGFERLRLYHYPATRSARVKWVLHETVGDAFETIPLDLYAGAQYAPGYVAINPNHNVPLLEIDFADGGSMRMLESAGMVGRKSSRAIWRAFPSGRLSGTHSPTSVRSIRSRRSGVGYPG